MALLKGLLDSFSRGAIGVKTGKTAVLPGFCKIEGGDSGGPPPCYGGLTLPRPVASLFSE